MADKTLLIYSTCPDRDTAERIANLLVERRLAACVSILPGISSVYLWQGEKQQQQEHLLMIKSTKDRYPRLEQAIRDQHPYELPEIVAVHLEMGLQGYLDWISQCTEE